MPASGRERARLRLMVSPVPDQPAPAAVIRHLRLYRFRNHLDTAVSLHPGLNVIVGPNAQGKTNLLEAIATLALTRSPRTAETRELITWESSDCAVEAHIERPPAPVHLAIRLARSATGRITRTLLVDRHARPATRYLGLCPVVLFWPADLQLVTAGPEIRRRLLDTLLAQTDARTTLEMARYRRVVAQRNALLQHLREHGGSHDALATFTESLVDSGTTLRAARISLLRRLVPPAIRALSAISDGQDQLSLHYVTDGDHQPPDVSLTVLEAEFRRALRAHSENERRRGVSLAGPHRDDIAIHLSGRPAHAAGSHGQHRSIALALKLAEVTVATDTMGMAPILLIDDVLGELDDLRLAALLSSLRALPHSSQVIATATTLSTFQRAEFPDRHLFALHRGTVTIHDTLLP